MDNKLLNKAITINAKEEKLQGGKPVVKIKDEKGLTYTVYKTKQDGSTSIAWEQLGELSIGDTVQIGYVEEIVDNPQYGTTTYRTIRNFNKDIGEGSQRYQNSPQAEKPRSGQNLTSQSIPARNYEREAYEKCCSLWAAACIQHSGKVNEVAIVDGTYWQLFQTIKKDGEKRFAKGWQRAETIFKEELPSIQIDGDEAGSFNPMVNDGPSFDVSDIPF